MAFSSWKGCFVKVYEVVFSTSADHSHFCNSGSTFLFFRNQLRIAWKLPVLISEKGFSDAAGILDIKDKIRRNKRSEVGLIKFFYFSLVLYTLLKDPDVRQQNTFLTVTRVHSCKVFLVPQVFYWFFYLFIVQ